MGVEEDLKSTDFSLQFGMEKYYTIASADFIWNLADGLFIIIGEYTCESRVIFNDQTQHNATNQKNYLSHNIMNKSTCLIS
jgi:hypothetical protein